MASSPVERTQAEFEAAVESRLGALALTLDLDSFQAIWLLHQAADAARRRLEDSALAGLGVSWMQFEVLWHLWIFGQDEPQRISRAIGIPKSSLTAVVRGLTERGYVARRASAQDGRRVILKVTSKGSAFMTKLFPRVNHAETQLTRGLTSAQTRTLSDLLRAVIGGEKEPVSPAQQSTQDQSSQDQPSQEQVTQDQRGRLP